MIDPRIKRPVARHPSVTFATPAILAAAALLFLWLLVTRQGGDIGRLPCAGEAFVDATKSPACLAVAKDSAGYDGQFYYRLAIAPFDTSERVAGVRFDYAVYRSQRILYPLVAHVLSAGDPCRVLWILPLINIISITALGWCAAILVGRTGVHPLWGIVAAIWPGFLFSLARNLTEPMECAFLVGGFAALSTRSYRWATLWFCCAALTRETAIIAAVVILFYGVVISLRDRKLSPLIGVGVLPPVVYMLFKLSLFELWSLPINLGVKSVVSVPFAGFVGLLRDSIRADSRLGGVQTAELIMLALLAIVALLCLRSSAADIMIKLSCVTYVLFAAAWTRDIWTEDWAFLRASAECGVLCGIVIATARPVLRRLGATLLTAGTLGLAYEILKYR